jgi:hypothetical protein
MATAGLICAIVGTVLSSCRDPDRTLIITTELLRS